jgi:hypothetical protein
VAVGNRYSVFNYLTSEVNEYKRLLLNNIILRCLIVLGYSRITYNFYFFIKKYYLSDNNYICTYNTLIKMQKLLAAIHQLETYIPSLELNNSSISAAGVGWHLEHIMLTINGITTAMANSNSNNYKWTFNFTRVLVFTLNKIPRGKAKSPDVVIPKTTITAQSLLAHVAATKVKLQELQSMPTNTFFKHPFFGNLKLKQTIQFLEIHTTHHLDIVADIVKKQLNTIKE